jgi:integrase
MRSGAARVLGPYRNAQKWRLIIREGRERKSLVYDTKEQAENMRGRLLAGLYDRGSRMIGETIEEFLEYKRKRGCNERTLRTVQDKLLPFLPSDLTLGSITPQKAEHLYEAQTEKVAVATHHKNLRNAKAFFGYCVKQKYIPDNPFADVQAVGKANAGKPQLRTDEARKLSDFLIHEASRGDARALALMVQVLLGLRSGEVLKLRKRDLDCNGTVVVVEGTKSKNAKRTLELDAPVVRDLLLRRCETLTTDGLIFAQEGAGSPPTTPTLWKWLTRFCEQAGVPRVCPHSLRGLHSSLAVKAGATSTYVAQALGHGSDSVTRRHYIAPGALDSARAARVAGLLLGEADLEGLIGTLRRLPGEQLDRVCSALGLRR